MINVLLNESCETMDGCAYHRLYLPYSTLKIQMQSKIYLYWGECDIDKNTKCLVTHYNLADQKVIEKAHSLGAMVVLDVDDYWHVEKNHLLYKQHQSAGRAREVVNLIKNADIITTTTSFLAEKIEEINPNVFIFPNALCDGWVNNEKIDSNLFRIGYMGGACHLPDMKQLKRLGDYLKDYSDKIEFVIFGNVGKHIQPAHSIYQKYKRILTSSNGLNVRLVDMKLVTDYLDFYTMADCFIAPLENNYFNKCKSPLKLVESAWHRKPVIFSDVSSYHIFDNKDVNRLLCCKNEKQFADSIIFLYNNPIMKKALEEIMYSEVKEKYNLDTVTQERKQLFESIFYT